MLGPHLIRRASIPRTTTRIARKAAPRRKRKTSVAALKRKLWALVARYVLDRDKRVCYTCGGVADQAGHFVSRRIASLWIDPKNVAAQDARCNLYLHGNHTAFAKRLRAEYGDVELDRLHHRANSVTKQWRADELLALIDAIQRDPAEFECLYYEHNL